MRVFLLIVALACTAAAQTAPVPVVAVTDENGVAVRSARVYVQSASQPATVCDTDFSGRCRFPDIAPGSYEVRVEKQGYYKLEQQNVQIGPASLIELSISHLQEVREVVNVSESPQAIDPTQVSSQESISGLDVINMVYPNTNDYRNALNFIPGVVNDQNGQPHVAGAQTYQTETMLDSFNVTQPANGLLLVRVSTDAFRSIQVEPSREPAEAGKGSGGLLQLNTGIGDDHYRFFATNFIPSVQDKHGWRFDQFLPRFTTSGPIVKGKIWYYDAFDGEYDNLIFTELPVGADNDHILRIGNLSKVQTNLTNRNILTASFLVNYLHDQFAYLSPQSPQFSNPKDVEYTYIASIKDQHYFKGGELLETGLAFDQYNIRLTPYGNLPYSANTNTAAGSYYLGDQTSATRWQLLSNLYLPEHHWLGRHDFKVGIDLDRIIYDATFSRAPISYLSANNTLTSTDECLTASAPGAPFACTRYSTFTAAPLHEQYNAEVTGYAEDRWSLTNRLLLEPGVRLDWDEIVRHPVLSPRIAGTYVLDNAATTKFSAGVGIVYDATPVFLIARPFAGTREDCFYNVGTAINPNCNSAVPSSFVTTSFAVDRGTLEMPRFLNWSMGLERKLPRAIYLKAEFLQRRGNHGFVYDLAPNATSNQFLLINTREDHFDSFQVSARHNFRETYMIMGAFTRSRARSNQALDFNVDNPILSGQQPGPYLWDAPNRFLSWGYLPFFNLPVLHKFELAYSAEARTGFPFSLINDQGQLISKVGADRFPYYFSLNLQLEKQFHLFGNYFALRGGFDNITGRCDPFVVNNIIDPIHPLPTFSACIGRAFTSRIRLLGKK
jgi:hypothetical protein